MHAAAGLGARNRPHESTLHHRVRHIRYVGYFANSYANADTIGDTNAHY